MHRKGQLQKRRLFKSCSIIVCQTRYRFTLSRSRFIKISNLTIFDGNIISTRNYHSLIVNVGNQDKQVNNIVSDKTISSAISSTSNPPGNPHDNTPATHATGIEHLKQATVPRAVEITQKEPVEIPQAITRLPEAFVQPQEAFVNVPEPSVDSQGQEGREITGAPGNPSDTELRESQDRLSEAVG